MSKREQKEELEAALRAFDLNRQKADLEALDILDAIVDDFEDEIDLDFNPTWKAKIDKAKAWLQDQRDSL